VGLQPLPRELTGIGGAVQAKQANCGEGRMLALTSASLAATGLRQIISDVALWECAVVNCYVL
jgi:hypothetical protein